MPARVSTGFASAILGSQSFESIFNGGSIEIRTGTQPDNADMPATGTVIARVTRDGGAWAAGSLANGLQFTRSGRYAMKPYDHVWQLKGSASGVAGWFRLVGNAPDDGSASLSLPRIDGTVRLDESVGDGQLILITTNLDASTTIAIDNWWYAIPPIGD